MYTKEQEALADALTAWRFICSGTYWIQGDTRWLSHAMRDTLLVRGLHG